jgi:TolB-like protein
VPINGTLGVGTQTQDIELTQNFDDRSTLASSVNFQEQFKKNEGVIVPVPMPMPMPILKKRLSDKNNRNSTADYKEHGINYYIRGLMQDLVANLQYVNSTTSIAVVSFVMLDSNYNVSNLLGIQIAEGLMHEVHKFGIPVIDFKTTGYIRVTEQGDFAFSKDYGDFSGDMPANYILGGTMLKHIDGYLINARIVGVKSQVVVASAQNFIPNSVSDSILMTSAVPELRTSNEAVESSSAEFALISQGDENATDQPVNGNINTPSPNKISLIQE